MRLDEYDIGYLVAFVVLSAFKLFDRDPLPDTVGELLIMLLIIGFVLAFLNWVRG